MVLDITMGILIDVTTMWAPVLLPFAVGAAVLVTKLIVKYGPAALRFVAMFKRAAVVGLQYILLAACCYILARSALSEATDTRFADQTIVFRLLVVGNRISAAVGSLTMTAAAIYFIEMMAANHFPRSAQDVIALHPLTFCKRSIRVKAKSTHKADFRHCSVPRHDYRLAWIRDPEAISCEQG